jgi:copper(I)-binding protein
MNYLRMLGLATVAAALLASGPVAADAPTALSAWARATPPGADVAAVYVTLRSSGTADRLAGAGTPRASMTHLHTVEESGGVAKMRPVDGIEIPAGKTVVLAPKGHHLMLMGIGKPLVAGEHFPLTLHFERGGDRIVDVAVRSATAAADPAPPAQP